MTPTLSSLLGTLYKYWDLKTASILHDTDSTRCHKLFFEIFWFMLALIGSCSADFRFPHLCCKSPVPPHPKGVLLDSVPLISTKEHWTYCHVNETCFALWHGA